MRHQFTDTDASNVRLHRMSMMFSCLRIVCIVFCSIIGIGCKFHRCHATQGGTAYNLVIEYLQTVMAKDPNFTTTLFTEFSKQCTIVPPAQVIYSLSNVRLFRQQYDRQSAVDYVKCVISAITNGVDESDYAYLWNTYLTKIEKSLQNVVRCKNQGSPIDAAK